MAYQTAKFRDAFFFTVSSTTTFGRRTATYELPFDEKGVAHTDLGRSPRRFHINAILLRRGFGELAATLAGSPTSFEGLRDKLVKALETRGPGQLVHPDFGSVMVVIKGDIEVTHSTEFGGMCEISFNAIESRDPLPASAKASGLLGAVDNARDTAGASLVERLLTEGPDYLLEDVHGVLDESIKALRNVNSSVSAWLESPANLARSINDLSLEVAELLDTPRRLFDAIDGFVESLMASAGRVFDAASQSEVDDTFAASKIRRTAIALTGDNGIGRAAEPVAVPLGLTNTHRDTQRENRAAMAQSLQTSVLANAVGALAKTPPNSRTQALEVGQALTDAINTLADGSIEGHDAPAALYDALKDLAAALQDYMDRVAGVLARTRIYKIGTSLPVEVLAHKLYGDAERAVEILARNPRIPHGGMLPGQGLIEVLDR